MKQLFTIKVDGKHIAVNSAGFIERFKYVEDAAKLLGTDPEELHRKLKADKLALIWKEVNYGNSPVAPGNVDHPAPAGLEGDRGGS